MGIGIAKGIERRRAAAQKRARSLAAKKGWETRRKRERAKKLLPKKKKPSKLTVEDRLELARDIILGADYDAHGRVTEDWDFLSELIKRNDYRWEEFLELALELEFNEDEARDAWFSPDKI